MLEAVKMNFPWKLGKVYDSCRHSVGIEDADGYHIADISEEKYAHMILEIVNASTR